MKRKQPNRKIQPDEQYRMYQLIAKGFIFNPILSKRKYEKTKFNRQVSMRKTDDMVYTETTEELISRNGVVLYPESLMYLWNLDGATKKLLLYLLFFCVWPEKNYFYWSPMICKDFNKFCLAAGDDQHYKASTLRDAMSDLTRANVCLNVAPNKYMLNPVIAGANQPAKREQSIKEYSKLLVEKGKDTIGDFYSTFG